jgi:acyl carrier protein
MEKEKFISGFRFQFEETDSLKIQFDTEFKKMETWDSLTKFSIIAFVQDEYSLTISNDDFQGLNTPMEIWDFIIKKSSVI